MSPAFLLYSGVAIVIGVIYALIKQYEARMVLFAAGLLMCTLALAPLKAFDAFAARMVTGSLIQPICSVMGFAFVINFTKCDKHLVNLFAGVLIKMRFFLIPGTTLATFAINTALPSAAGVAAAVGTIFIPLLIGTGIHPATAAAAVMAGTFGSMLSPGLSHNPFIANLAKIDVLQVIQVHYVADIVAVCLTALGVLIMAVIFKETKGYVSENRDRKAEIEKINYVYALMPVIPVFLLLLSANKMLGGLSLQVPHAMLIGVILTIFATRSSPAEVTKAFIDGMGSSYGQVISIICCAAVFVAGMEATGLIKAFTDTMVNSTALVKIAAAWGPYLLGVVCGSGDAAAFAFNEAVTPHARQFGMEVAQMGSLAALTGAISRIVSPICPGLIICASIAGVNPMELSKRTLLGSLMAVASAMFILT